MFFCHSGCALVYYLMCCHVVCLWSRPLHRLYQAANIFCHSVVQWLLVHRLTGAGEEVDTVAEDASTFAETDP